MTWVRLDTIVTAALTQRGEAWQDRPMQTASCDGTPDITLCMIVRDEAAVLGRCLESAAPVVDELVVVDTGSVDGTAEIARAFGARVETFIWRDDFAAARNHALSFARGGWVLVLDADERVVTPDARERLLEFARSAGVPAGQIELENLTQGGRRSRTLLTRFFQRAGGVHYERRIHEQLVRSGAPWAVRPTGVRVLHDGYAAAQVQGRDKLARNEALLRAQIAEQPGDGYDWYQLGRVLEVGERFQEALAAYEQALELVGDAAPHLPHLLECAATCLRALDRSRQALDWLGQVEGDFRDRPDLVFLVALLAMDVGELARAEDGFRRCLEFGVRPPPVTAAESSLLATTLAPAHNLGVLYECTGRVSEARAAYERALGFDPQHEGARAGIARLAAMH